MCYIMPSSRVGVRELRQNLSKYLRRVLSGETLEVTEGGRPVAVLAPLREEATALSLGSDPGAMVTYDVALASAARAAGIDVLSPGS